MTDPRGVSPLAIIGPFLRSHPTVTAAVGQRSTLTLRNENPSIRYSLVSPGFTPNAGTSFPRVQVEVWGADTEQVDTVALDVVQALSDLPGHYAAGDVAGVLVSGPYQSDDPTTSRARQLIDVQMLMKPTTGGTA